MLRTLIILFVIATPLWSQDLLVDSIDREFSGTLIKITDTYIHFQIQGEPEAVQYPYWSVQRVTLADGRLAFEEGKTFLAKPGLPPGPKPVEPTPTVAKPMEPQPMEAGPDVELPTPQPALVPEPAVPESAEPEPLITAVPVAGQNGQQLMGAAREPFPMLFTMGLSPTGSGINFGVSYRFSKPIGAETPSVLAEGMIYPVVTAGFLSFFEYTNNVDQIESVRYGLVEGHWHLKVENLRGSVFLGAGLGSYDYYYYDFGPSSDSGQGTGMLISAGAQARVWRLTGDLRFYRTPGLGKFISMANVGYQPKSIGEVLGIAGVCCAIPLFLLFALIATF